jgi:hypothetical protein
VAVLIIKEYVNLSCAFAPKFRPKKYCQPVAECLAETAELDGDAKKQFFLPLDLNRTCHSSENGAILRNRNADSPALTKHTWKNANE